MPSPARTSRSSPWAKSEVRELIWRVLEIRGAARFPGSQGRIPNFIGAERAALQLCALPAWRHARVVEIGADAAQLPVRRIALREGKVVYMPVPPLADAECFLELDPGRLGARASQGASLRGAVRLGRPVEVDRLQRIDLVVYGAVAVNGWGARVGQGGGLADLAYGLLAEAGKLSADTPVVTTVHALQVVPYALEMLAHDVPVDVAVTPDGPLTCPPAFARPRGICQAALTPERVAAVPALRHLLERQPRGPGA